MDRGNEQILTHRETLGGDPGELLADLQSGLHALRCLIAEIDAREQQLRRDAFRSVLSQFDKLSSSGTE
jgi:hypothetical protein